MKSYKIIVELRRVAYELKNNDNRKCGDIRYLSILAKRIATKVIRYFKAYFMILLLFRDKKEGRIIMMATPEHGNLGDQAIAYTERNLLVRLFSDKKIIEIPNGIYLYSVNILKHFVWDKDIIIIDGGGNLGTLWTNVDDKISDIIRRFKNNRIVVFPQTCYYDDTYEAKERLKKNQRIYSEAKDLTIMFRDKTSYDFALENFTDIKSLFVPDFVLSFSPDIEKREREGVLLCFRADIEKVIDKKIEFDVKSKLNELGEKYRETTTVISKEVSLKTREEELYKKWYEFSSAKLIITDRLHAMIFATITETPCIAVDNKSQKVGGTYDWIKSLPYICYLDDGNKICENIEKYVNCTNNNNMFKYPIESVINVLKNDDEKYNKQ